MVLCITLLVPRWLQGNFRTLVGLFDRVGMNNNVRQTVGIVFCPCQVEVTQLEAAYERRMTVEGHSYRKKHWGRIQRKEYGEYMDIGLLVGHMQIHCGSETEGRMCWESTAPVEELHTYRMTFLTAGRMQNCPVEGCLGRLETRT